MWELMYSNPFSAIAAGFAKLFISATETPFAPVDPYYQQNPQEAPQFGAQTDIADVVASGILSDYQAGSAEVILPSYDLPPPANRPPSQTVPGPPTGAGSSGETLPLPLAPIPPFGPWGFAGSGSLRPTSDSPSEKRIRAERDRFARSLGLKVPKRKKTTTNALASRLAKRLTVDVLKKIEMPAILRSITAGAGVRMLGPLGAGITAGSIAAELPASVWSGVKKIGMEVFRPGGSKALKAPADALQPIAVTAKRLPGGDKTYAAYPPAFQGIRNVIAAPFPKLPPAAQAGPPGILGRMNPKTLQKVKAIGAALDALKKRKSAAAAAAALGALPTPLAPIAPSTPMPMPFMPPFAAIRGNTSTSSSGSACSCKPKKRGKARKCLERASVVYKGGRYKGKAAGTKCIRYAS